MMARTPLPAGGSAPRCAGARHGPLRRRIIVRAMAAALCAGMGMFAFPETLHAVQAAMPERVYAIPAGSLGAVIDALGRQGDVQVIYAPGRVRGKTSPGLSGRYTVAEALNRVLKGTGLAWRPLG